MRFLRVGAACFYPWEPELEDDYPARHEALVTALSSLHRDRYVRKRRGGVHAITTAGVEVIERALPAPQRGLMCRFDLKRAPEVQSWVWNWIEGRVQRFYFRQTHRRPTDLSGELTPIEVLLLARAAEEPLSIAEAMHLVEGGILKSSLRTVYTSGLLAITSDERLAASAWGVSRLRALRTAKLVGEG